MKRDYKLYIGDIIEAMNDAENFISGMTYEDFSTDRKTILAVICTLEIIGEAVKNIPD